MGIAERDYMRRGDETPQIRWEYVLIILIGVTMLITFGLQHCPSTAEKDRPLTKGALVPTVNEVTAKELQTLPGVGPARAERIIQYRPYQSVDQLFRKAGAAKNGC